MNIKKILHHILFGVIAYFAFGLAEISVAFTGEETPLQAYFHIPPILTFLAGMAVFLVATGQIITYNYRNALKSENSDLWKKEYSKPTAFGFAVLLGCCVFFYLLQDTSILSVGNPTSVEDITAAQTSATNLVVLFLGAFFLWLLFLKNMILDRYRNWPKTVLTFVKSDVSVYLIFRAAVFLLSLGGALLMGGRSGEVQNSYFLFALDDEQVQAIATGSLSSGGSFFSGVTEAASFYVLITMAEEMISGKGGNKPAARLRRMFLEADTVKLLCMTLICILTALLSFGGKMNPLVLLANTALILLWLMAALLFLADTAILPYAMIFASLGFIERILPMPEVPGYLALVYPLIVAARILLFSVAAVMIANYQIHRKQATGQTPCVTKTGRPTFSHMIWNVTFMDAVLLILRLGAHGLRAFSKKTPASAEEEDLVYIVTLVKKCNDYIEKGIERVTKAMER